MLEGHFAYFGITGNLATYPLPAPRIVHRYA
jgi:hypothetical protein